MICSFPMSESKWQAKVEPADSRADQAHCDFEQVVF